MTLFKYVGPERIDILTKGQIRFSQAEVWNDPFELQPCYQDHIEKNVLKQFAELGKILNDYHKEGKIPTLEEIDRFEYERKRITKDDVYRYLNKKIVSLSLTESKENLLMWSHYTNNHKGFVMELDTDSDFFKSPGRCLHKVNYCIDRPKVNTTEFAELILQLSNLLHERHEVPSSLLDELSNVFKKGSDWCYEKEWRLITTTESAINFQSFKKNLNTIYITGEDLEKHYVALFQLPLEIISAIYIGERAPDSVKRKLYLLTKYNPLYSHIKLVSTKIDKNEYKLSYSVLEAWDVLKAAEVNIDIAKVTYKQRFTNPYLNSYYKEIMEIKKMKPLNITAK